MTALLILALAIGIRHAFEPDHVAAVLTVSTQSNSLTATAKQGAIWGIGHTITLFTFSMLLMGLQVNIDESVFLSFECLVGIVLILMGFDVINKTRLIRDRTADQGLTSYKRLNHKAKLSLKALGIGLLHGAAGSGVIIAIVTTTIDSTYLKFAYIALFSVGLIISMSLLSMLMSVPLQRQINVLPARRFKIITGSIAILIGVKMLYASGLQINTLFI